MGFADAYLQYELATVAAALLTVAVFVLADLLGAATFGFLALAVLGGFVVALVALRVARGP